MTHAAARTSGWNKLLQAFPTHHRADIDSIWDNHGCLPAAAVGRLLQDYAELGKLMMSLLPLAKSYAVVPVSGFPVGAVAAGMPIPGTGWCSLYLGANFEFSNLALSFSVHAEQSATNHAWLSGETGLQALGISAAPCGYCRQFLYELSTATQLNILLPTDRAKNPLAYSLKPLTYYLPDPFGPNDLPGVHGGLMDPKYGNHKLSLQGAPPGDPVTSAALRATCASYAVYPTDVAFGYAGVAVEAADGQIYAGRNAENAAYNPSLSPLQSALSFMAMSQPPTSDSRSPPITRCVLVEVPTLSSQLSATQAVLAAYISSITVEYRPAMVIS